MRQVVLIGIFLFFSLGQTQAQKAWGGGVDNEQLHFGFTFQYISSEFKTLKVSNWRGPFPDLQRGNDLLPSPMVSISSVPTPGFGLGFVTDYRLGENLNLRFTPGLVFPDRVMKYEYEDSSYNTERKVEAPRVDLPLGLKLKSDRRKNFRAYMIAGAKYSMDIVSKKKTDDSALIPQEKYLKNNRNTLWYEAGIGLDLYFEFFKLSPEIKFAQSFKSVLKDNDRLENPYTAPIDKLFLRSLQFSLYFE